MVKNFRQKVLKVVAAIPAGQTLTYQQVAIAAGRPRAWRAVGNLLSHNFDPAIACHRVIRSNGQSGGYNRGQAAKVSLLKKEKALVKS